MPQDRNLLAKKNVVRSAVKLRPGIPTFLFLQAAWSSSASCIGTNGKDLGPVSHRAYWLNSIRTAVDDDQSLLYRSHLRIHDPTLFAAPAWRCHFRLRTYRHDFTSASTLSIDTASIIIIIILLLLLRTIFPYPQPYWHHSTPSWGWLTFRISPTTITPSTCAIDNQRATAIRRASDLHG
ncbi:hypothetical protein DTO045G8_7994 [Paecilomyces variotii]|nr:hypothetical protein DTO045G8_7994 [Paecilomyces variotii]